MLYHDNECWVLIKVQHIYKMSVIEMQILKSICDRTRFGNVKNNHIYQKVQVECNENKKVKRQIEMVGSCYISTYKCTR